MYFFLLLLNLDTVSGNAILVEPVPRLGTTRTNPQKYVYGIHGTAGIRYPFSNAFLNTCGTGRGNNPGDVSATYSTGEKIQVRWRMLTGLSGEPERIRVAIMYSDDDNFNDNVIYDVSNNDVSGSLCPDGTNVDNGACQGTTAGNREPIDFDEKFAVLTKPCTRCVLQWVWDTRDGYGFVDCADIEITGEPITDTNTAGPPVVTTNTNPQCNDFCFKLRDTCPGQYESVGACNRQCQSQARSILTESITGDTFECRRSHMENVRELNFSGNRNAECSSAGPSGDSMCLPTSACDIFCNVFNEVCKVADLGTVAFPGFQGIAKCVETCSSLNQTGVVGAMSGNTLQCREFQLALASDDAQAHEKETFCSRAQPEPTQVCVSYKPCDTFCSSWDKWCGGFVNITQYTNCTIECENIISIGNLGDRSGNTLQCREYYLGAAALTQQPGSVSAKIACESAAKDGGEFCRGSPPGSTSNAVKLRIAGGLGTFVVLLVGLF